MEDPEFTDFWQLLGDRDAIAPEIQRAALAAEVFWPCEIYYHAPADVRDGLIHALLSAEYSSEASNLMSCLAMQGDDKAMETLLELERNPRPWRKGLYVDPSSYAQIGRLDLQQGGPENPAQLRHLLSYGQGNRWREISRPHWPGAGGHLSPTAAGVWWTCWYWMAGMSGPVPGAGWYPDRHLLPQPRGIPERPAFNRFFSGWRRGGLSLRTL